MSPERRRLSRGQAKHRRGELAQEQKQLPSDPVTETVGVIGAKRRQLREISEKLKSDTLKLEERTLLAFQRIWLKKEVGEISESTKTKQVNKFYKVWKERFPETYKWFFEEKLPNGQTRAFQARQEVVPDQSKQFRHFRP